MTTRNIAPRENGEGSIGTSIKRWLSGFFNALDVSGNVTANGVSTASLSVSGTATGVTPQLSDNSQKFATTEFVNSLQRFDVWAPNRVYTVGNIVKTPLLPSQWCLECISAGTSGATEPSYAGADVGDEITDGGVVWEISDVHGLPKNAYSHFNGERDDVGSSAKTLVTKSLTPGVWLITGNIGAFGSDNFVVMSIEGLYNENFTANGNAGEGIIMHFSKGDTNIPVVWSLKIVSTATIKINARVTNGVVAYGINFIKLT